MAKENLKKSFSVLKKMIKGQNETLALEKAVASLKVSENQLQAAHTETQFVFNLIEVSIEPGNTFKVEKTSELTLQDAKKQAMVHFNTFEGNIKTVDENETHFVFSKVRG